MIHPTPTQTLLTTTFEPLVMQLSSSLARGARIINQFVQAAPTPTGISTVAVANLPARWRPFLVR